MIFMFHLLQQSTVIFLYQIMKTVPAEIGLTIKIHTYIYILYILVCLVQTPRPVVFSDDGSVRNQAWTLSVF